MAVTLEWLALSDSARHMPGFGTRFKLLALATVVCVIGWAGLYPFDFALINGVTWTDLGPGLRFEGLGVAYSQADIEWHAESAPAALTLEMWLRTETVDDSKPRAWLVFADDSELTPLGIRQEGTDLVVWDAVTNPEGDRWYNDFRVQDAIRPDELQHIAVTSSEDGPRLYIDGALADTSQGFPIPFAREDEHFGGTLVLGSGPPWDVGWSGEILRLLIYGRALSPELIKKHADLPPVASTETRGSAAGIIASYGFDEQNGSIVTDRSGNGNDLNIPDYYHPPKRKVLGPIDLEHWSTAWYAKDVLLNVGGFACLGFLLASVLSGPMSTTRLFVFIVGIGFLVSLTIELTQALMVSRNSSTQDLILNLLGTVVGGAVHFKASQHNRQV